MKRDLEQRLGELRKYYSDEEIADTLSQGRDFYIKEGYDKGAIDSFVAKVKQDPGITGAAWQGLKSQGDKLVAGGAQGYIDARQFAARVMGDEPTLQATRTAQQALAQEQAQKQAALDKTRQLHPFAMGMGEALPAALPAGRSGVLANALSPALGYGAMGALQYGSADERARRGVQNTGSALLGNLAAEGAQRVIKPVLSLPSAPQKAALGALAKQSQATGVPFKPRLSEQTGSQTVMNIEDTLAQTPFVDSMMKGIENKQVEALNAIAAKSIGQDSKTLSREVLDDAYTAVDQAYSALRSVKTKNFEMQKGLADTAAKVIKEESMKLTPNKDLMLYAQTAQRLVSQKAKLTGPAVDVLRKEISEKTRAAAGGEQHQWNLLLKAFDDSVRTSAKSQGLDSVVDGIDKARSIYRNLKTIDRPNIIKGDNIMPQSLRSRIGLLGNDDARLQAIGDYAGAFEPLRTGSRSYGRGAHMWLATHPVPALAYLPAMGALAKGMESDVLRNYLVNGMLGNPGLSYGAAQGLRVPSAAFGTQMADEALMKPVFGGRR